MSIRRIWKRSLGTSFFYWAVSTSVLAADFALTVSNNDALCNYMLANFQALPPKTDLTCRMQIAPGFERLTKPEWEELDPLENLQLYRDDYRYREAESLKQDWQRTDGYLTTLRVLFPNQETLEEIEALGLPYPGLDELWAYVGDGFVDASWERQPKQILLDRISAGNIRLATTQVDPGEGQSPDAVYGFSSKICMTTFGTSGVTGLKGKDKVLDQYNNRFLLDWRVRLHVFAGAPDDMQQTRRFYTTDMVLFDGEPFIIDWDVPPYRSVGPKLIVYPYRGTTPRCEFKVRNYGP